MCLVLLAAQADAFFSMSDAAAHLKAELGANGFMQVGILLRTLCGCAHSCAHGHQQCLSIFVVGGALTTASSRTCTETWLFCSCRSPTPKPKPELNLSPPAECKLSCSPGCGCSRCDAWRGAPAAAGAASAGGWGTRRHHPAAALPVPLARARAVCRARIHHPAGQCHAAAGARPISAPSRFAAFHEACALNAPASMTDIVTSEGLHIA